MKFRTIDLYNKIYNGEILTKKYRNAKGEILQQDPEDNLRLVMKIYSQFYDLISQSNLNYSDYFKDFMLEEWEEIDE